MFKKCKTCVETKVVWSRLIVFTVLGLCFWYMFYAGSFEILFSAVSVETEMWNNLIAMGIVLLVAMFFAGSFVGIMQETRCPIIFRYCLFWGAVSGALMVYFGWINLLNGFLTFFLTFISTVVGAILGGRFMKFKNMKYGKKMMTLGLVVYVVLLLFVSVIYFL